VRVGDLVPWAEDRVGYEQTNDLRDRSRCILSEGTIDHWSKWKRSIPSRRRTLGLQQINLPDLLTRPERRRFLFLKGISSSVSTPITTVHYSMTTTMYATDTSIMGRVQLQSEQRKRGAPCSGFLICHALLWNVRI
jgi:hypothetical protein